MLALQAALPSRETRRTVSPRHTDLGHPTAPPAGGPLGPSGRCPVAPSGAPVVGAWRLLVEVSVRRCVGGRWGRWPVEAARGSGGPSAPARRHETQKRTSMLAAASRLAALATPTARHAYTETAHTCRAHSPQAPPCARAPERPHPPGLGLCLCPLGTLAAPAVPPSWAAVCTIDDGTRVGEVHSPGRWRSRRGGVLGSRGPKGCQVSEQVCAACASAGLDRLHSALFLPADLATPARFVLPGEACEACHVTLHAALRCDAMRSAAFASGNLAILPI